MLTIRGFQHVLIALIFASAAMGAHALDYSKISSSGLSKNSARMKPWPPEDATRCGVDLFYPALKNFFDQEIKPECVGSYHSKEGAGIVFDYTFGSDPQETQKSIDISVIPIGIDKFVGTSNQKKSSVVEIVDGQPRVMHWAGLGNECHNLLRTSITPISTTNWQGWTVEDVYGKSRIKTRDCRIFSPEYRCISFVVGNSEMSAEFGGACFPRKRTLSLNNGISYDLFMKMVKSIRFREP
ncbi:hypothetical protein PQQ52_05860 [Paraburkholderia sediminicola]|uniref:hypothetical protein n=1 Tax=Paraburkholderia sediminicola TaxID=458836 RepID=UPI0038B7039C